MNRRRVVTQSKNPKSPGLDLGKRRGSCSPEVETGDESIFFQEWLAGNRCDNQLAISAVCNSHCIFCSNQLNPFPIQKGVFRDIEDIKLQLSLMKNHDEPIRMSDSLPGRVAEGEAFLHPQFFDVLAVVRKKYFSNLLCFTTNASMLDEPFLKELARYRPVEITVSMHSTQPKYWARIFGKREEEARKAVNSLERIKKYRLALVGTIVPLPRICGWEDIERTYTFLVSQGAKKMALWWPGSTVCTPPDIKKDIECPLEEFLEFTAAMKAGHKVPLLVLPEMSAPVKWPVRRIMAHTMRGNIKKNCGPFKGVLWLASEAAYERLRNGIAENAGSFTNRHYVFPVKNQTYGGNIIVAGLLMVNDFLLSGKEAINRWRDIDLILVPETPFDSLNRDLQRTPAYRLADELGKPVWIVNESGSFNPLLGDRMIHHLVLQGSGSDLSGLGKTMRIFNLGWQDALNIETSLDLIDSYPLQTSRGVLARARLREMILEEIGQLAEGPRPLSQSFHILDDDHALCIENWAAKDEAVTFNRWVFLVRRDSQWKVQEIRYGKEDPLSRGNGGPKRVEIEGG